MQHHRHRLAYRRHVALQALDQTHLDEIGNRLGRIAGTSFLAISTLTPWAARIERAFPATVLGPEVRLHLDLNALLRADPGSVAKTLMLYRQGGIVTPNEARADLGYPARPDGDSIAPPLQGVVGTAEAQGASENEPPADSDAEDAPPTEASIIDINLVRRLLRQRLAPPRI